MGKRKECDRPFSSSSANLKWREQQEEIEETDPGGMWIMHDSAMEGKEMRRIGDRHIVDATIRRTRVCISCMHWYAVILSTSRASTRMNE